MSRAAGPAAAFLGVLLACLAASPAAAQEAAVQAPESAARDASKADLGRLKADPCRGELPPGAERLDAMRAGLRRGVCSTARFVDQLFGRDDEYFEYGDDTNGRAAVALGWNEQEGVEVDTRFRASVPLPQINERFNATIGRASRDEYVADEPGVFDPAIVAFSDDEPAEWFAGIGYRAHRGRDDRFDLGAGVKLETPLNPYANARYRRYLYLGPSTLLTMRTTAFVENAEGFGVTQALDFDRVLTDEHLLRFGVTARLSEATEGVRWRLRSALYQAVDHRRAMRYEAIVRGETDGTQPDLYALGVTHRRSVWRDWLFLEVGGELFWADGPLPADRCDACIGLRVGFEVLFGEGYDRALRRDAERLPAEPAPPGG